jgi:hypothetical protein
MAAAAAAGATSVPRSRSRFAEQAELGGVGQPASAARPGLAPVPEEERGQEQCNAAARPRGRPRKVAFAVPQQAEEEEREAASGQPEAPPAAPAQPPPAPEVESRRSRRMTRAAAAAAPLLEEGPAAPAPAEQGPTAEPLPDKLRRGRRRTQAVPALPAAVHEKEPDPQAAAAGLPPAAEQEQGLSGVPSQADAPRLMMHTGEQAAGQPAPLAEAVVPPAAVAKHARRRGRCVMELQSVMPWLVDMIT